jgi:hypothetical protein
MIGNKKTEALQVLVRGGEKLHEIPMHILHIIFPLFN